jgi:hypothetical protein
MRQRQEAIARVGTVDKIYINKILQVIFLSLSIGDFPPVPVFSEIFVRVKIIAAGAKVCIFDLIE